MFVQKKWLNVTKNSELYGISVYSVLVVSSSAVTLKTDSLTMTEAVETNTPADTGGGNGFIAPKSPTSN